MQTRSNLDKQTSTIESTNLTDYFKVFCAGWEHPYGPDELIDRISFAFTMKRLPGLYFKLKKPLPDDYGIGMDCFQFAFDTDNGIYINDGDMRFNDFMGQEIKDSGADIIPFIKEYLQENNLSQLIRNP